MAVYTTHLAALYAEAARIAERLDHRSDAPEWQRDLDYMVKAMERIDNLVAHARQELQDEYLRARDGWSQV
jgi:hypothetical protein